MPRHAPAPLPVGSPDFLKGGFLKGETSMQALIGIVIILGGIAGLLWARARGGNVRSFVNTHLEVPVALAILGTLTVGTVLLIAGIVPEKG